MSWFVSTRSRSDARMRLFCLPYAGAGAGAFRHWQAGLDPEIEVLPVQLPGREHRIMEDPRFTVAEVAAAIAERADGPFAIYGHSMGGRVGFEVVRELRRAGGPLPVRLYVGGCRAPHVDDASLFDGLSKVDDDELLRRLGTGGGLPAEVLASPELVELLLPLLRADFGRVDEYTYLPGEPLPMPIVAFHGRTDPGVSLAQTEPWAEHTVGGFALRQLDGGHFFLQDNRDELLALLRADLLDPGAPVAGSVPAAASAPKGAPHRVPLGDTGWSVWRDAVLRTTGFPADGLTRFAGPAAAAAADRLLATGDGVEEFDRCFADALRAGAAELTAIAADPLLREAVTWQNTNALIALDGLVAGGPDAPRNVRRRDREKAVLRYWQRYCGKNETVGFFGPNCWVTVDPELDRPVVATPGPALTRRRWVVLESWAVTAYAEVIGRDLAVRRWWAPRLSPHLSLTDRQVRRPGRPPLTVTPVEAAVLAAADGSRPAVELVADPALGLHRPEDGYTLLDRLVERELVTWDAGVPATPAAERVLHERIERIGDDAVRATVAAGFARLRAARDDVAAAAGDPDRLRTALAALDEVFTDLTGLSPRRRDGQMYAGRTLVYEDTTRDLDAVFGAPLLDRIAAPMDVLLRAARWLAGELRAAYDAELRQLHDDLRAESGDGPVSLADLWYLAQGLFWGGGERPVDRVAAEFARRWAGLFGLDRLPGDVGTVEVSTAEIADQVAEAFPERPLRWSAARLHSPDLQICATDQAALERGDYTVVLGEMHAAWASFDCEVFSQSHPNLERLRAALAHDLGDDRIRLLVPTDWPRRTSRVAESLAGPTDRQLAFAPAPGADPRRLLPTVDVTVEEVAGELVATGPGGGRWPLTEVFSTMLATHAVDGFKLVAAAPRTPRITLDGLVVARRTWRTTVGGTDLAGVTGERERYLAVRRLRDRLDLPEQVYVKVGTETKPCFVDLTSPHYATALCSMLRSAQVTAGPEVGVVFSEMLPTPDQAWVPDARGRRYFSELRLHIVDEGLEALR